MLEQAFRFLRSAPSCNLHEISQRANVVPRHRKCHDDDGRADAYRRLVAHGRSPRPAGDVRPP
ncbi:glutamate synthase [Streptomyces filamentosus NRRL 15998]|uniref:Glutamate synthase n=1 Tax=Streptomyces filamentosus NRRL 15998 TaxID=457431 RepID=D6AR83_STRFL|nr:glutamate synthase [Streptomyces filamentosus NRRL 15998]